MPNGHDISITSAVPGAADPQTCALLRSVIETGLAVEGVKCPCEVDVLLTDNAGIRTLNRKMRKVDAPTDVLSFPALELTPGQLPSSADADPGSGRIALGDMAISMERVSAQAEEYGHSPRRELAYLAVHSLLHLLGYDHLDEGTEKARMRAREEAILEKWNLSREEDGTSAPQDAAAQTETLGQKTRTGIISIVGRPNVGKSTLLNALAGEKIAIVSHKPQTTRNRICAVVDRKDSQFVFMDTPGLHRARNKLGEYMVNVVRQSVSGVDAAALVVEPIPHIGEPERQLMERLKEENIPTVLVINKIDTVKKEELLAVIAAYSAEYSFAAVLPVSAKEGDGTAELLEVLEGYLTEGPRLFPEGALTDQPERQVCAELLREKLLLCLEQEAPHGTAVELTRFTERDTGVIEVSAVIYCEKESHKGMIIGKRGAMLKKISTLARQDMERFMGTKVYLETWVKVKENWRNNIGLVHSFGYRDD